MTYTDLQAAVISYFKRGDIASRVPVWIQLAESYLFRELAVKSTALSVSGTTTNDLVTLPADFQDVVRITTPRNGIDWNLDFITAPDEYIPAGIPPYSYSLEGENLRIHYAGTGTTYTLYYLPKMGNLSGALTTNWLIENAQDLYLYATALQGAIEMKNAPETEKLRVIVGELLDSVRRFAERAGQPLSARMQIKPRRGFST